MTTLSVPVLIVGGGLVGLATALLLAEQGVPVLAVEKHAGTALHPRARGFHASTIELFESSGLADAISATGLAFDPGADVGFLVAETLAGPVHAFRRFDPQQRGSHLSARSTVALGQDRLEPMLLDRARALGADVRFDHALASFADDGRGVTALGRPVALSPRAPLRHGPRQRARGRGALHRHRRARPLALRLRRLARRPDRRSPVAR